MNLDKMTKEQLAESLRIVMENYELPEEVHQIVNYALTTFNKNARKITKDDLIDTISHLEETTGRTLEKLLDEVEGGNEVEREEEDGAEIEIVKKEIPQKVENSKKEAKTSKIVPVKKDETEQPDVKEVDEKPKSTPKGKSNKVVHQKVELLANFPEEIISTTLADISKLKLRTDIKNISDVVTAFNNEEDIVIATYWTKRHLKQYGSSYDPMNINPNKPKEFEHDLDFIEVTYANELVVTGCSLFSYVPNIFLPTDFIQDEESNLRFANGCEFQVYEAIEYRDVEEE